MNTERRYKYYQSIRHSDRILDRKRDQTAEIAFSRLYPSLKDPNYLVLRHRQRIFSDWLASMNKSALHVLDVGGRIQTYRPLVKEWLESYIAIDPQFEGAVDVVGVGEQLPFRTDSFDLVICSQVLSYAEDPRRFCSEIHRVLKPNRVLLLSAPAQFPRFHDERWRFLPEGLGILLSDFSDIRVVPEGYSISGICRTINVMLDGAVEKPALRRMLGMTLLPVFNLLGWHLDILSRQNDQLTANYSVLARK